MTAVLVTACGGPGAPRDAGSDSRAGLATLIGGPAPTPPAQLQTNERSYVWTDYAGQADYLQFTEDDGGALHGVAYTYSYGSDFGPDGQSTAITGTWSGQSLQFDIGGSPILATVAADGSQLWWTGPDGNTATFIPMALQGYQAIVETINAYHGANWSPPPPAH